MHSKGLKKFLFSSIKRRELPEVLDAASKEVDFCMMVDEKFPSLEEQLKINASPSFSGMNDYDYPECVKQKLISVKRTPLPEELISQFTNMQCNCVMGIFPEISRAWLAIDSDIYFWVYEDGSDVAYFDGIKEVILAVNLINPKAGMFQEHIKYLLCVTTPLNIYLLGVSFTEKTGTFGPDDFGSIQLHPEPLFQVPSDNVYMTSITGTSNGRIFLAGRDSCLYELVYQAKSGWLFGQRCYKVNHSSSKLSYFVPVFLSFVFSQDDPIEQLAMDNTRGILYCRTMNGNIKAYYLGADLSEMRFMCGISSSNASKHAQYILRTVDYRNFEKIVHIAPVPKSDSRTIHLVAVTSTGVRLYFATSQDVYGTPSNLCLVHVRMPPGFAPSLSPEKPSNVHAAFYRQGTSILIGGVSEEVDRLWCLSQDLFPFNIPIRESESVISINGRTWCLSEIPDYTSLSSAPFHLFNENLQDPPSIITQHVLPARRFVLLSAQGSHILTTLRPLEKLRSLLLSGNIETDAVASFFQQYGADQACAVCITLVCQCAESEAYIGDFAIQAFFRYGSGAQKFNKVTNVLPGISNPMESYLVGSPVQGGSSQGSFLATPIPQSYHNQQPTPAQPNLTSTVLPPSKNLNAQENRKSGKYNGLVIYFSRLLRPIWNLSMVSEVLVDDKKIQLQSRLTSAELSWFTEQLYKLRKFMDTYSDVTASQSPTYIHRFSLVSEESSVPHDVFLEEKRALKTFHNLLLITLEALELWRVLADHQFHLVVEDAPIDIKEKLKHIPLKDLFSSTGSELSTCLINLLMEKYLHDNSAIENLSNRLREICPTIYSANDAMCTRANETVISASLVNNQKEKEKILQEALMIYSKVPDLVNLQWVTQQLKLNNFYAGIVQLCLTTALNCDPMGIALHFYKTGEPLDDIEGVEAFNMHQESYRCILETLEDLLNTGNSHPASPHLPTRPGPPVPPDGLSAEQARKFYNQMLMAGLSCGDELFHVALYTWLIKTNQTDRLLEIKSPFIEQYLISTAAEQHPNNKDTLDLLWKFYEKNNNFLAASKVLLKLAEREGPLLTIHDRLECLSRAVMSAKSIVNFYEGEFLYELEEKLEVARIQLQLFDQLSQKKVASKKVEDTILQLNSKLFDISALYEFAEESSLPVCKLAIIHCAGHADNKLVHKIWQEIVEQAFENTYTLSSLDKMEAISQQLVLVGKSYVKQEQYFPTYFLISMLERKSCEMIWQHQWVFMTALEMGIDPMALFNEYNKIFNAKENTWRALGKPLHILHVLSLLLIYFLENPPTISADRIAFSRSLFEATTSYLVELESMSLSDPEVKVLLPRFKGIQAKLKRAL
nr:nuclear pore complex protein Nup155-like [Hydra vulgaris]